MTYADALVGGIAVSFGLVAMGIAWGPWKAPYRLRSIVAIENRFGKFSARCVWAVAAVAALAAGTAIISGIRPSYIGKVTTRDLRR